LIAVLLIGDGGLAFACPEGSPPENGPAPQEVSTPQPSQWATGGPSDPEESWIISPAEADLPLDRQLVPDKSDPDGPKVTVRDPGEVAEVMPPVTIDIAFQADEGATVDIKSLKVTYLKLFGIDITERLRPYLTADGIHAVNAPLAPGHHSIEISVADTTGRRTVERFDFTVLKR
jgi:hypothetical protein